ncbi:unnamed protein product [Microthlaspi erraticum]|uniref:Arabidopsis retrotransposon Orf1 C-terminal domain-containing protein n=1 Tax=Microthlaspi erraticum TaxID=1685480 RepID=A0A6D2I9C6_9BRAS|nr:unnamed protein product [Microthlaspi erraticum]
MILSAVRAKQGEFEIGGGVKEEEDELPMYQEHYDALFSMDFMETKYPHVDTMKALGIFEDVELVLKNMHLAKFFSYHMESYKELTCEF